MKKYISLLLAAALAITASVPGVFAGAKADTSTSANATASKTPTVSLWAIVPTQSHMNVLMPAWQKVHPEIKIDYLTFGDSPQYYQKLQIAMQGDSGPDLFTVQTRSSVEQYSDFAVPVDSIAQQTMGNNWQKNFVDIALASAYSNKLSKYIGLPLNVEGEMMVIFNKNMMQEAGLTKFEPANYDEFKSMCDQIKAKGVIPLVIGAGSDYICSDLFMYYAPQWQPGIIQDAENGKVKWTDPNLVNAMNACVKLFKEIFQPGATGLQQYPDARDQYFYARKAAMFATGTWHVGFVAPGGEKYGTAMEKDDTGYFMMPQLGPNAAKFIVDPGQILTMNKAAVDPQATQTFWTWLTMGEGSVIFTNLMQGGPSRTDIKVDQLDAIPSQFQRDQITAIFSHMADNYGPERPQSDSVLSAICAAVQNCANGADPATELAKIQPISDKALRDRQQ